MPPIEPASTLRRMLAHELLTREQEVELGRKSVKGDIDARNRLIACNVRFAFRLARDHARFPQHFESLFSAALVGLTQAAERYDPDSKNSNNARFSSYARWQIEKQMFLQTYENYDTVARLPLRAAKMLPKVQSFVRTFEEKHDRAPSDVEIAEGLGLTRKFVSALLSMNGSVRLDATLPTADGASGATLHEMIASREGDPSSSVSVSDDISLLERALDRLSARQRTVLTYRFGLRGQSELTLEEIAKKMKVTRERIRQIEFDALREIRVLATRSRAGFGELRIAAA
jgi:RNA polymerase sigma factor (sigma-70 family)